MHKHYFNAAKLRINLLILFLTIIACEQKTSSKKDSITSYDLKCTISSDSTYYQKGHAPKVKVKIRNNSKNTIQLVKASDGSLRRRRIPYAYFTIEKIGDTTYRREPLIRCGNYGPMDTSDFVMVTPGEIFDPYVLINEGTSIQNGINNDFDFIKTGKYKIKYYYSTNEPDFNKWLGEYLFMYENSDGSSNKPRSKSYFYRRLFALFELVPKVELVSNELIIEIK